MGRMIQHPLHDLGHDHNLEIIDSLDALEEFFQKIRGLFRKEILGNLGNDRIVGNFSQSLYGLFIGIRTDTLEFR